MVTRIVVVVGVLMIGGAAAAVALLPGSSAENQSLLTHTISRGKLTVSVTEQGTLESSNNTEIKCKVRGFNLVTYVVPTGTVV